jgi:dienelactone hydrolase
VTLNYASPGGPSGKIEAVLRKPQGEGSGQALLLIHHAGGFGAGTTTQYADLFVQRGFTTLELRMFDRPTDQRPSALALYAMMAAGLRHLAQQPDVKPEKIAAVGLSLGAFMTITATSTWFYDHHKLGTMRFSRVAALYPVCWMMTEAVQGRTQGLTIFEGLPTDVIQNFARVPLLILAGGKDNYDGSNPNACPDFVKSLPDPRQVQLSQVKVYAEATHGWDHGRTYGFTAHNACPGRTSCRNVNVSNPVTVEKGKRDLLEFLAQPRIE